MSACKYLVYLSQTHTHTVQKLQHFASPLHFPPPPPFYMPSALLLCPTLRIFLRTRVLCCCFIFVSENAIERTEAAHAACVWYYGMNFWWKMRFPALQYIHIYIPIIFVATPIEWFLVHCREFLYVCVWVYVLQLASILHYSL